MPIFGKVKYFQTSKQIAFSWYRCSLEKGLFTENTTNESMFPLQSNSLLPKYTALPTHPVFLPSVITLKVRIEVLLFYLFAEWSVKKPSLHSFCVTITEHVIYK